MSRLFNGTTLSFKRYPTEQEVDDYGNIIIDPNPTIIEAKGSLQPLGIGDIRRLGLEGKSATSAYRFYTKTPLQAVDVRNQLVADVTEIKGVPYEVADNGDWTLNPTPLSHYKVVLVMSEEGADDFY